MFELRSTSLYKPRQRAASSSLFHFHHSHFLQNRELTGNPIPQSTTSRGPSMAEFQARVSPELYLRIKHQRRNNNRKPTEKGFFCNYRYLKWLLYFSISFFIIFCCFLTKPTPTTFSKPLRFPSPASRAVIEDFSPKPTSFRVPHSAPFNGMKVYVYDLPEKFNAAWLSDARCSSHLFATEVAIHRALMGSEVRTMDPKEADFFFVPVYVSCNFSTANGFPAIGHARTLMAAAVSYLSSEFPFWNRSGGADHIFVASHDFGPCFHTMEDAAMDEGVPQFLKNSIILQTFGVQQTHPCQAVEHVVIPPFISPETIRSTLEKSTLTGRRDIFAFFRGKMELHPKNVTGNFYSRLVRTKIWRRYSRDRRFYLQRKRFAGYQSEIARSKFCLCPRGWAPWSPRLVESVALGCVPVVIADGIRLPFPSAVPWPEISINVAETDVDLLGLILEHVAKTNLTTIQRYLRDPRVRRALLFYDPMVEGDATWQILMGLSRKMDRSYRKSKVSIQ